MRFPRVRFTVRRLMIAVLVIGLGCGGLARWNALRLRRLALQARASEQSQVTTAVIREVAAEFGTIGRQTSEGGSTDASPDRARWTKTLKVWAGLDASQPPLIDVEISGGGDGDGFEPIAVRDRGGPEGRRLTEPLVRAYRERGWRCKITPSRPGAGPSARGLE